MKDATVRSLAVAARGWAAVFLLASGALALDTTKLHPTGYVNDFANVLDAPGRAALEVYCGNLEQKTGAQVAVVFVETLDGDSIDDDANKLYQQWGIGKKGQDEGLLFLLAVKDRKQRVEVGYGLEPVLPDGAVGDILRGIRPILRQGNYSGAVLAALQQFGARIAQEKGVDLGTGAPQIPRGPSRGGSISLPQILLLLFFLFVISRVFRGGGGGGGGGLLTGMILGNMLGGRSRYGGGGWGGGGFGGGGGGGFGGFGGGGSGGGGASSDW